MIRVFVWNGQVAEPICSRRADGLLTIDWPEDAPDVALVNRELLLEMVREINKARGF